MTGPIKHFGVRLVLGLLIAAAIGAAAWRYGSASRDADSAQPAERGSVTRFGNHARSGEPRLVALSPAIAIMLKDLGREDLVVGRHAFDMVLPKTVPVCGDQQGIDYESLLSVRPTDVLMQWGARDLPPRLVELSRQNGWAVADYRLLALDDVVAAAADLASHYGGSAGLVERMRAAWAPHPGRFTAAGRVLLLESVDPPAALGPGSFHQQILERIGGTPAIARGKPYMTLDAEAVLAMAPDAIIVLAPREAGAEPVAWTPEQVRARLGRLGELDIPAVKNGRLAVIDDPLGLTPSTALLGVTDKMERMLGAWVEGKPQANPGPPR